MHIYSQTTIVLVRCKKHKLFWNTCIKFLLVFLNVVYHIAPSHLPATSYTHQITPSAAAPPTAATEQKRPEEERSSPAVGGGVAAKGDVATKEEEQKKKRKKRKVWLMVVSAPSCQSYSSYM